MPLRFANERARSLPRGRKTKVNLGWSLDIDWEISDIPDWELNTQLTILYLFCRYILQALLPKPPCYDDAVKIPVEKPPPYEA